VNCLTLLSPPVGQVCLDEFQKRVTDAAQFRRRPFSDHLVSFCTDLGKRLFRTSPRGSSLQALGFFLREAYLSELRTHFEKSQSAQLCCSPRGIVFQIPPANVSSLMLYSWLFSAITGNVTVARIPGDRAADVERILSHFNEAAAAFAGDPPHTFFVDYPHDEEITAALSRLCDVRVIWGGDETVNLLRTFPLSPGAKDVTFQDRHSLAAISAENYTNLSVSDRDSLIQAVYRDLYTFDQVACSSPRLVVWVGSPELCTQASSDFYTRLATHAAAHYNCALGTVVSKKAFVCMSILDQNVQSQTFHTNELTVVRVDRLENLTREHCGGGFLFEYFAQTLSELQGFVSRRDQTLTYSGFCATEIADFVEQLGGRGLDRIVPVGQALSFSHIWDGYDLLQEFVRRTHVVSNQSAAAG